MGPKNSTVNVLDNLCEVVFLLDVVIMFFTSFKNKQGQIEYDSELIGRNYISQLRFKTDVLALISSDVFSFIPFNFYFTFFKLFRVKRISRYITELNYENQIKSVLKFAKLSFYLILMLHFQACQWYFLVSKNSSP